MGVVCSWCEVEGKPTVVREKEPLDDPDETHGVCPEDKEELGYAGNSSPDLSLAE